MKTWVALVVWVILFGVMFLCSLAVDLEHNVIVWQWHGFTNSTVESLAIYAIALAAMVVIAPMTKTRIALRTMWALLLVLAVAGLDSLRPEIVKTGPKPRTPSPIIYRASQASALTAPLVLVLLRRRRSNIARAAG